MVLLDYIERLMAGLCSNQESLVRICAKCLAALSEKVEKSRLRILSGDSELTLVGNLLTHELEEVRGNGALIVSNVVSLAQEKPINLLDPLLKIVNEVNIKSGNGIKTKFHYQLLFNYFRLDSAGSVSDLITTIPSI